MGRSQHRLSLKAQPFPALRQRRPRSPPESLSQKYFGLHGAQDIYALQKAPALAPLKTCSLSVPVTTAPERWAAEEQGGEASRLMANLTCLWLTCGHQGGTGRNWELLGFSLRHFSLFGFLLAGQGSSSGWV